MGCEAARSEELNEVADSFGGLGDEFIIKRKKKKTRTMTRVARMIQKTSMPKQALHCLKSGEERDTERLRLSGAQSFLIYEYI